jgi:hypothetical protein
MLEEPPVAVSLYGAGFRKAEEAEVGAATECLGAGVVCRAGAFAALQVFHWCGMPVR